jgi:phage tail-like protein
LKQESHRQSIFSAAKMPETGRHGNVTLKRALFKNDTAMQDFYKQLTANTFQKATITIFLLDESQTVAMSWTLSNAVPVKTSSIDMKGDANEVAIESMELVYEGLTIAGT